MENQSMSPRTIKVMPDFCSTGLWDEDGSNMDVDSVSMTPELRSRLESWCARYDREGDTPEFMDPAEAGALAEFAREGLAIAAALKREHPEWTVTYFDEHAFIRGSRECVVTV